MGDYDVDDDLDGLDESSDEQAGDGAEQQQSSQRKPNWRRQLEARARAADQARAEADAAKRELALIRAGIDLDSPQGKLFAKAYDGEPAVDAIRKAAEEYGVLAPPTPPVDPAELSAHTRVAQASAGSPAAPPADPIAELDAIPLMKGGTWNPDFMAEYRTWANKHNVRFGDEQPGNWLRPDATQPVA